LNRQPNETHPLFQARFGIHHHAWFHRGGSGSSHPHLRVERRRAWAIGLPEDFPFGQDWNGKVYATKQVRPVFVDEPGEIVVITVYTYYF
jgi:hypothetical protein